MNIKLKLLSALSIGLLLSTSCSEQQDKNTNNNLTQNNETEMNNSTGTTVTLGGKEVHTVGKLPEVGSNLKDFTLTDVGLEEKTFNDYKGKNIILNIFPSVNTGVCAQSVRSFNEKAANMDNTVVLCISKDLPFAQKEFCGAEGIDNVVMLSDFRNNFGHDFGVQLADGAMKGLLSRAVIVVNPQGKIVYEEQVSEIGNEPNYEAAIGAIE